MRENSETRVGKKTKKENQKIEIETKVTRASPPIPLKNSSLLPPLSSLPRDGEKKIRIVGRTRVSTLVTRQVRGHGGREHTIHSQHERYKPIPSPPVSGPVCPTLPLPLPLPCRISVCVTVSRIEPSRFEFATNPSPSPSLPLYPPPAGPPPRFHFDRPLSCNLDYPLKCDSG